MASHATRAADKSKQSDMLKSSRKRSRTAQDIKDPETAARAAGLRYTPDTGPGITREPRGDDFRYRGPDGHVIRDKAELERIKGIVIPPAWTDVWINPNPRGHIQATGRDAKGRKQYRYHPAWRVFRAATKFHRMIAFGEALPTIRERVTDDLETSCLSHENILATVVRLLDETSIRIGNEEYARENESYGLTTLRNEHVSIKGSVVRFEYVGKSGKEHSVEVHDRSLAKQVRKCQDLPGHELFQYVDENGERHAVESGDVNDYLRTISGSDFTAKDFRTWTGTVVAAHALKEMGEPDTKTQAKKSITQAVKLAAERLGNTPAVARKSYVHPGVMDAYLNGTLFSPKDTRGIHTIAHSPHGLHPEEAEVLALLKRLERSSEQNARRKAG